MTAAVLVAVGLVLALTEPTSASFLLMSPPAEGSG